MGGYGGLEALVDQGLLDGACGVLGDLVEHAMPAALSPGTRFAASRPVVEEGTPAAAWTLWVSSTTRVGSSNRRAFSRTWQRRSS